MDLFYLTEFKKKTLNFTMWAKETHKVISGACRLTVSRDESTKTALAPVLIIPSTPIISATPFLHLPNHTHTGLHLLLTGPLCYREDHAVTDWHIAQTHEPVPTEVYYLHANTPMYTHKLSQEVVWEQEACVGHVVNMQIARRERVCVCVCEWPTG